MINNPEKFMAGIWNWDFISDVLPSKLKVSDIDGVLERNGWLLCIETKSAEVQSIPLGQYILYENMVKSGTTSVLFIYGDTNKPTAYQVMCPIKWGQPNPKVRLTKKIQCNTKTIQDIVKKWYTKANERKVNHNQNIQF